jgi:hypothetical protein
LVVSRSRCDHAIEHDMVANDFDVPGTALDCFHNGALLADLQTQR